MGALFGNEEEVEPKSFYAGFDKKCSHGKNVSLKNPVCQGAIFWDNLSWTPSHTLNILAHLTKIGFPCTV